jgi:hypothetical protein
MKLALLVFAVAIAACSSSGSTADSCTPAAGTYVAHYTVEGGSAPTCMAPPDSSITVSGGSGLSTGGTTSETTDAGSCTTSSTACSLKSMCTTTESSVTVVTNVDETFTATGGSGTESTAVTTGGQTSACNFAFTWTKQ